MPPSGKPKTTKPPRDTSQSSKKVTTKAENKLKEIKGAYEKISKMGPPVKGGPRPKMKRMAQPAKPKSMTKKATKGR
jgi:hypothetical protein